MINKYKQNQVQAYLQILNGASAYWQNELEKIEATNLLDVGSDFKIGPLAKGVTIPNLSDEAKAEFQEAVKKNFNKSRESYPGPPKGSTLVGMETTNHAGDAALRALGNWIEEAGPINPKDLEKVMHRPKYSISVPLSFAEFKEKTENVKRVEVYTVNLLRADVLDYARCRGYALTAETPRSPEASILEFTLHGEDIEDNFVGPAVLFAMYVGAKHSYTMQQWAQIANFAKLVRELTIAEYKNDGCYEADVDLIKLPKDFKI